MSKSLRWQVIFPFSNSHIELLSREKVFIDYSSSFCTTAIPGLSERIDKAWERALTKTHSQKNILLFDKPKFRLSGICSKSDGVLLQVGPTTYKEYVAFRTDPILLQWAKDKAKEIGIDISELLPNVIGNVALVLTTDSRTLAIVRSAQVGTYKRYLDLPGGHPEPLCVEGIFPEREGQDLNLACRIRNELFISVLREIEEDIGVDPSFIQEPKLLGILTNLKDVMKPDMVFIVRANLSSQEVKECFLSHMPRPKEVGRIVVFDPIHPKDELMQYKMTPIMEGALALIQLARRYLGGLP